MVVSYVLRSYRALRASGPPSYRSAPMLLAALAAASAFACSLPPDGPLRVRAVDGADCTDPAGCTAGDVALATHVREGDATIASTSDAETLREVRVLRGTLTIRAASGAELDLEALSSLEEVGALVVADNLALESLEGLRNLRVVHGDAEVRENPKLHDLVGLRRLETVEGTLAIGSPQKPVVDVATDQIVALLPAASNRALQKVWLPELRKAGALIVLRNELLESLEAPRLEELTTGNLDVSFNPALASLGASFPLLRAVKGAVVLGRFPEFHKPKAKPGERTRPPAILVPAFGNDVLRDAAFPALVSAAKLEIGRHPSLASFDARELSSVLTLDVRNCPVLARFRLTALASVGSFSSGSTLTLEGLPMLVPYFPSLVHVAGDMFIAGLDAMTAFNGFDALTRIDIRLDIRDNPKLTSLRGLEHLETVRVLYVADNPLLESVSGLANLHTVHDSAEILGNGAPVIALPKLRTAGAILIQDNAALTTVDLPLLETLVSTLPLGGVLTIEGSDVLTAIRAPRLRTADGLTLSSSTSLVTDAQLPLLRELKGSLSIVQTLTSMRPFGALESVGGDVRIQSEVVPAADLTAFVKRLRIGGAVETSSAP